MPGPVPKKLEMRQRRNKTTSARVFSDKKLKIVIPELPKRRRKWRRETISWWKDIWHCPMAVEFIESDKHQLYILADLIDQFWREEANGKGASASLATEIRLQRQCFGMTPIDRRRLQWDIEKAEKANMAGQERREKGRKTKKYKVDPRAALDSIN
jgi:hypothetical protein